MNVFKYKDYKALMKAQAEANDHVYGYRAKMAEAAGCQRSFISQVLNGSVHLTADQAVGLTSFWRFTDEERDHFLDLVALDRAATPALKSLLKSRLQERARRNLNLSERLKAPPVAPSGVDAQYFSSWLYAAVHMLTTVPAFRTAPAIAKRLQLGEDSVKEVLRHLEAAGLVTPKGAHYVPTQKVLHVTGGSLFDHINQTNWRLRALADLLRAGEESIHYSAVFSLSHADIENLRHLILEFIERKRALVQPSPEEDVVAFTLDFFRI